MSATKGGDALNQGSDLRYLAAAAMGAIDKEHFGFKITLGFLVANNP